MNPLARPLAALALALAAPAFAQDEGKRYAVLVGVNDYDHAKLKPLKYAEADAAELHKVLADAGFEATLLTAAGAVKPTRANLNAAIAAAVAACTRRGDAILVAFAGYGRPSSDKDDETIFFCPRDGDPADPKTLLSLNAVIARLDESRAGVKLLLADLRSEPGAKGTIDPTTVRPPKGFAALFGCAAGESSHATDKLGGLFFHHVCDGLRGAAGDGREVDWDGLARYVRKAVPKSVGAEFGAGAEQNPTLIAGPASGPPPVLVETGEPVVPESVKRAALRALKKPDKIIPWKAVIARRNAPVYDAAVGGRRLAGRKATFGEAAYVAAVSDAPTGSRRYLLGRFADDGDEFRDWIGWIDEGDFVDEEKPLRVARIPALLGRILPKDHPQSGPTRLALAAATGPDFANVPLKVIPHPTGTWPGLARPVPFDPAAAAPDELKIADFGPRPFAYVYKIAVDPAGVYLLVGRQSELSLDEGFTGDRFRDQLVGWVDVRATIPWTTREAFEFRLEPAALASRRKAARPIELYATAEALKGYAAWERADRKGDAPVKPAFREDLDPKTAPEDMAAPWPKTLLPARSSRPIR